MSANSDNGVPSGWLLLVLTISGEQPALRMRTWRGLKALGVGVLRDGVYVLPSQSELREPLREQADEVIAAGGTAQLLEILGPNREFAALFDRTADYAELVTRVKSATHKLKKSSRTAIARAVEKLRKEFAGIVSHDFFPGPAKDQAREQLDTLTAAANQILDPGEPHAAAGRIKKLSVADYQNRTWATRKRPWIDRLASAWLIHRFIDQNAKIKWLDKPEDCPRRALSFDFDGAMFTHIGAKVTFEVVSASFSLDGDAALERLGAMVHYLDVGGIPVAEAVGFEAIVRGARQQNSNDDKFLVEVEKILDFVYASYC